MLAVVGYTCCTVPVLGWCSLQLAGGDMSARRVLDGNIQLYALPVLLLLELEAAFSSINIGALLPLFYNHTQRGRLL